MTNEELAQKHAGCAYCHGQEKCLVPEERCTDYNLAKEVADAKDNQFKQYLEQKMVEEKLKKGGILLPLDTESVRTIKEIIREFFN